jgi:protein disulfide-isomerase A1
LKNAAQALNPKTDSAFQDGIPLGYIFTVTSDERARLSKMVEPLAKKYKDKIQFGTVDVETFGSLADDLHLENNHWPAFAIREPVTNLRFPLNDCQELSEQKLDKFLADFMNGKLKPTIKSQPLPEMQKGPVIDVVALNYDDIVVNNEKDVLIEFYTQWCVPCRALLPTYEKLAQLYASDKTLKDQVTIAKMDAEANDVRDRDIRGFPTFKLFPTGSKESPVLYGGPSTLRDMAKFIRDNGKHKAELDWKSGAMGDELSDRWLQTSLSGNERCSPDSEECGTEMGQNDKGKHAGAPQKSPSLMVKSTSADHGEL